MTPIGSLDASAGKTHCALIAIALLVPVVIGCSARAPARASASASASASTTPTPVAPYSKAVDIRNAAVNYDFRLVLAGDCAADVLAGGIREAPGEVVVFPKGGSAALQHLKFETLDLVADEHGQPLVNSSHLYDYQGTLNVGDFDFDGHEDFAVQDSQQGLYGGPTFCVFLFSPGTGTFVRSEALSTVTHETLGMFQVDAKRQRLITFAKDGCCMHETDEYAVVHGALVRMASVEEDATHDGYVLVTTGHLEGGKWRTATRRQPTKPTGGTAP